MQLDAELGQVVRVAHRVEVEVARVPQLSQQAVAEIDDTPSVEVHEGDHRRQPRPAGQVGRLVLVQVVGVRRR